MEHAEDVGPEGPLQLRGADVLEPVLRVLLGGVVDQQIEPAEGLDGAREGLAAERLVADVAGDREAAPPLFLDQLPGRAGVGVLVEIDDRDLGALLGEADRDRPADPAVAAGDQGDLAGELAGAPIVAHLGARLGRHLRAQAGLALLLLGGMVRRSGL